MSRFDVWLEELYFEDNGRLGRRTPRLLSVIKKTLLTIPHAFMVLFTNFGSAMPRTQRELNPRPVDPAIVPDLSIELWPTSASGKERGLPYSDATVAKIHLNDALARVYDLKFVMREVHRVCTSYAKISLRYSDPDNPFALRTINRKSVDFLTGSHFMISSESEGGCELKVRKTTEPVRAVRKIDVGCGASPREGYTGIDYVILPWVEIVRDVERHGLPFSDSTITHVYTAHFLEHVRDLIFVMNEIHRVCCNDALVEISVPTLLGPFAAADPTHVHLFNARTFTYFEMGSDEYAGITKGYEILEQRVSFSLEVKMRVIKDGRIESGSR